MAMLSLLVAAALIAGTQDTTLSVIPRPVRMTRAAAAAFVLTPGTRVVTDAGTRAIGYQLADWIAPATGYRLTSRRRGPESRFARFAPRASFTASRRCDSCSRRTSSAPRRSWE